MEMPDPATPPSSSQPKKPRVFSSKYRRSKLSRKKGGEVRMRRADAKDFVYEVRSVFGDDREEYMRFLNIMRSYKLKSIDVDDVKWFVEKLFQGRVDLIMRMNDFLPMGHKIKIDVSLQNCSSLKEDLQMGNDIDSNAHKSHHGKADRTVLKKSCRHCGEVNCGDLVKYVDTETDLGKVTSEEKGGCDFRKMDGKDGDCVGASEDSSGHNSSDRVQYLNKSIFDIDFSGCQHCSPSYYHLPENLLLPPATCATEDDASVLNDKWVSVPSGSELFKHRHKNQYEEKMFKCEDERYELDMLFKVVKTTIKAMENLYEDLPDSGENIYQIPLKDYFSDMNLRCIERLYDDNGLEAVDNLQNNACIAVPIILNSLKRKRDEFITVEVPYKRMLCEVFAQNYRKLIC